MLINNQNNYESGRVIVSLNKNYTYQKTLCTFDPISNEIEIEKTEILYHSKNLLNGSNIGDIILIYLKSKEKKAVINAIEKLSQNPHVIFAEPDYFMDSHIIPNDRYFRNLWGMQKINAPLAWNTTRGSKNVVVGVIDSGVDFTHPDLIRNLSVAISAENGLGIPFSFGAMDTTGHGTHVAGTVGAVGNNFIGVTGVCWNINLVSIKIGSAVFNLAAAIKAIDYANQNNIPILNNSWGGRFYSSALKYAIDNYDGLFIASAGNDGSNNDLFPLFPASYDSRNIISVAATNPNDILASFSNYGAISVDIAAPGMNIFSTDLSGEYSFLSGTSMAAPHIAGAAALLMGYKPNLTIPEIKNIILSSVDKYPALNGRILTGGIININKMLETARQY